MTLDLPTTETFDDWTGLGRKLCASHRTLNWIIGDWLIYGSERFGEKARDEARAIFRSDVDRFDPILKTCRRFPDEKRHKALTFGHHLAVMPIADDMEAERLLTDAERDGVTVAAFKAAVKVHTHRQPSFIDDDPQDARYRSIIQASNRAGDPEARQMACESIIEANYGVVDL